MRKGSQLPMQLVRVDWKLLMGVGNIFLWMIRVRRARKLTAFSAIAKCGH